MEKIDGIDLTKLVESTAEEVRTERVKEVNRRIRWVLQSMDNAVKARKKAENEMRKADEAIQKAKDKIERIKSGDWNIINAINPDQKQDESERDNRS